MSSRYWIELRGAGKILLFVVMMGALLAFLCAAPAEAWSPGFLRPRDVRMYLRPWGLFALWGGAWFALLFVRAEAGDGCQPSGAQMRLRLGAAAAILLALVIISWVALRWMDLSPVAA